MCIRDSSRLEEERGTGMKMTLETLLEEGKEKLEKAGVPDPLLDARFLLLDVFDMNFASFLVKRDRPITGTENGTNATEADTDTRKKIDKYWELISKREMRIPLQQLTGCLLYTSKVIWKTIQQIL